MKILIVGAGIGGLTLAAYLQKKRIAPTVIEQTPEWANVGLVLAIFPNGMRMLNGLGIGDTIKQQGAVISKCVIRDGDGDVIVDLDFDKWRREGGQPFIEIERDLVHKALLDVNKKTTIRMNTKVKTLKQTPSGVEVTFTKGKQEIFDLVVGAGGIDSQIRQYIQPQAKKDYTGSTYWATRVPKKFLTTTSIEYYLGNGKLVAIFPTKNTKHVYAFFTMPAKAHNYDDNDKADDFLRANFNDMSGVVPSILNHLPTKSIIYHDDDNEVHLKNWYKGRIVLLGDSAHALSPLSGVGASMAMEDAFVLADELAKNNNIDDALYKYQKRRKPRVAFLQRKSKQNHMILAIRSPWSLLRNLVLRLGYGKYDFNVLYKFVRDKP